jgi:enoyl-CoA hydratase
MIRWEQRERVGIARLDRHERRNALTVEGCRVLLAHLSEAHDLRVIILTGSAGVFCAGADLDARLADANASDADAFRPAFDALCAAIAAHPAIVIAAVDGPALGAGTQLAAWSDIRIAGDSAVFGIPAGKLGVHVAGSSIARLVSIVGLSAAQDLLLTSRTIDADVALRIGLAQRRCADALSEAIALGDELATHAPLTLAGHKEALGLVSDRVALDAASRDRIAALEARAFASADFREGLAARVAKRQPRFTGE